MTEVARSEDLGRFRYEKPLVQAAPTTVVPLGQTDVLTVEMLVVQPGTARVFDANPTTECVWFVVGGRSKGSPFPGQLPTDSRLSVRQTYRSCA